MACRLSITTENN